MPETTNRIEKQIVLKAPRAKVWRALINPQAFGEWFGVKMSGPPMAPGQHLSGNITYPGWEHLVMEIWIESVEAEKHLSWRWHPAAIEPNVDYSTEPTTLVVFELQDVEGGTLLKVIESGFDALPLARRAKALGMNASGWQEQMLNIDKYVATH
jgi:uncharacterized protein YndB with AHSA1/START domain